MEIIRPEIEPLDKIRQGHFEYKIIDEINDIDEFQGTRLEITYAGEIDE